MSIISRLRSMFSRRPGRKALASVTRPAWASFTPTYAIENRFEQLVKEGYRKNELIFACIARTAVTGAQIALTMTQKSDKQKVEEHPLLSLMRKPNPNMSEAEFWSAVIQDHKLAGRSIWEIERTNGGQPVALWRLRPDWIEVVPAINRPVVALYIYMVPGMVGRPLDPVDVLDFPMFDPISQYATFSPVAVAARVGDIDNNITDFVKLLLEHGGMPMGVLKTTLALDNEEAQDIRERWASTYGGFENWARNIAVLDRDAEYQRTGFTMAELGFEPIDARNEARICSVLDVPPILVGAKVGLDKATYSNYETALKAWWQNSIIPLYESLLDTLNSQLLPQFDTSGRFVLGWDLSRVPALQENADKLWTRMLDAFSKGLLTLNQTCEMIGIDTQPNGDYYLRPSSVVMVPLAEADVKPEPPPQLAPGNDPGKPGNAAPTEDDPVDQEETDEPKAMLVLYELKRTNDLLDRLTSGQNNQTTA
jgi:HK97 family phage portal protein